MIDFEFEERMRAIEEAAESLEYYEWLETAEEEKNEQQNIQKYENFSIEKNPSTKPIENAAILNINLKNDEYFDSKTISEILKEFTQKKIISSQSSKIPTSTNEHMGVHNPKLAKKESESTTSEFIYKSFEVLSLFRRKNKNSTTIYKSPTKESLRIKMIRGLSKAIRQATQGIMPKSPFNMIISKKNKEYYKTRVNKWNIFLKYSSNNHKFLGEISKTLNDPVSLKRTIKEIEDLNNLNSSKKKKLMHKTLNDLKTIANNKNFNFKSFSEAYCLNYFKDERVRKAFELYIDYLFSGIENCDNSSKICDMLAGVFKFICCETTDHLAACVEKWSVLNKYLKGFFCVDFKLSKKNSESPSLKNNFTEKDCDSWWLDSLN